MSSSFYSGPKGEDFHIKKIYNSLTEFISRKQETTFYIGDYIFISYGDINNTVENDNGIIQLSESVNNNITADAPFNFNGTLWKNIRLKENSRYEETELTGLNLIDKSYYFCPLLTNNPIIGFKLITTLSAISPLINITSNEVSPTTTPSITGPTNNLINPQYTLKLPVAEKITEVQVNTIAANDKKNITGKVINASTSGDKQENRKLVLDLPCPPMNVNTAINWLDYTDTPNVTPNYGSDETVLTFNFPYPKNINSATITTYAADSSNKHPSATISTPNASGECELQLTLPNSIVLSGATTYSDSEKATITPTYSSNSTILDFKLPKTHDFDTPIIVESLGSFDGKCSVEDDTDEQDGVITHNLKFKLPTNLQLQFLGKEDVSQKYPEGQTLEDYLKNTDTQKENIGEKYFKNSENLQKNGILIIHDKNSMDYWSYYDITKKQWYLTKITANPLTWETF